MWVLYKNSILHGLWYIQDNFLFIELCKSNTELKDDYLNDLLNIRLFFKYINLEYMANSRN